MLSADTFSVMAESTVPMEVDEKRPGKKSNRGFENLSRWNKNTRVTNVTNTRLQVGLRRYPFILSASSTVLPKKIPLVIVNSASIDIKPDLTKSSCASVVEWAHSFDTAIHCPRKKI